MILEVDNHVRKIGSLLDEGRWNKATQNMWNQMALPIFMDFIQRNKCPRMAQHVVQVVLDELAQRMNNQSNTMSNVFHVEPHNTLGQHAIQLLLIPSYTVYHCAVEVERLRSIESKYAI